MNVNSDLMVFKALKSATEIACALSEAIVMSSDCLTPLPIPIEITLILGNCFSNTASVFVFVVEYDCPSVITTTRRVALPRAPLDGRKLFMRTYFSASSVWVVPDV